jgi:hypothetical protein
LPIRMPTFESPRIYALPPVRSSEAAFLGWEAAARGHFGRTDKGLHPGGHGAGRRAELGPRASDARFLAPQRTGP